MPDRIDETGTLLTELLRERDALEAEIETMIGDMAAASDAQRRSGDWAENGAATKRYLDLTERLGDVEQAIIDLTRKASSTPPKSLH